MHGAFFAALVALAHLRAEPFLLLGFAMGVGLGFVAPPAASPVAAGREVWAAYVALVVALFHSSVCGANLDAQAAHSPEFAVHLFISLLVVLHCQQAN